MKALLLLTFMALSAVVAQASGHLPTSPETRMEEHIQGAPEQLLVTAGAAQAAPAKFVPSTAPDSNVVVPVTEEAAAVSHSVAPAPKSKKAGRMEKFLIKKLNKANGLAYDDIRFEDAAALLGAAVVLLGIVLLLFNPLGAIATIILGLAVYFIATYAAGGDMYKFFDW